jgi:hypothetical protein
MNIAKLQYKDKETAIADLIAKGVYKEVKDLNDNITLAYGDGIQAVVEIGLIVLENGTYNENFEEITAPVYADGYHFDVMSEQKIDFENEIFPVDCVHSFAGYNTNADGPVNLLINEELS